MNIILKIRFILAFMIALSITGCATEAKYKAHLESWNGKNISDFIDAWGYPDQTIKSPDGNTVYVYKYRTIQRFPGYQVPVQTSIRTDHNRTTVVQTGGQYIPGNIYHLQCTTWIEFNAEHIIEKTLFKGNDCVAN